MADILRHKGSGSSGGNAVATVSPSATLEAATRLLGERRIGALVVSEDGVSVAGILSERDVVAHLAAVGRVGLDSTVATVMTREVRTCEPSESLEQLMKTMTDGRFRHVPVVVDGRLTGIVSIGDLVARRLDQLETESARLHDYIQTGRG
ncbi:MAG: CBS domain-containing protein [Acidimicrobiales bacterium]